MRFIDCTFEYGPFERECLKCQYTIVCPFYECLEIEHFHSDDGIRVLRDRHARHTPVVCVEKNLLSRRHCANANRIYILQGKLGEVSVLYFPRLRNDTRLHTCRQSRTSRPPTGDGGFDNAEFRVNRSVPKADGTRKLFSYRPERNAGFGTYDGRNRCPKKCILNCIASE